LDRSPRRRSARASTTIAARRRNATALDGIRVDREVDMATVETATEIRTSSVDVLQEQPEDLRRRIAATRWPRQELVADRSQGVQLATPQELTRYWVSEYEFGPIEARLNALPPSRARDFRCLTPAEGLSPRRRPNHPGGGGGAARGRLTTTAEELEDGHRPARRTASPRRTRSSPATTCSHSSTQRLASLN
jgi:hypothetical protein